MTRGNKVLFFDCETHNAGREYDMEPHEFFRLGQYAWGRTGEVQLTTSWAQMIDLIESADLVIGHHIHSFDLSVLYGVDSTRPLELAFEQKVLDTFTWASVVMPAPDIWEDENGTRIFTVRKNKIDMGITKKWLGLNNLNTQLGIPAKTAHLSELAKKHNPPKTAAKALDYGLIPLDDPEFLAYAKQDVIAVRALALALLAKPGGVTPYIWREQKFAAVCAQNSRNGWRVNKEIAQARVDELATSRDQIMTTVIEKYGLPTEGKMPWRTSEGKAAIFAALADYGITPETVPDWPQTDTGKPSLGGEALIGLTEDTPAADLGSALASLMGQRSLAQLALDSVKPDGFVHPSITSLQRSGRLSTTEPGLTVWTTRGEGAVEKSYFIPDTDDQVIVEFDLSQADARIVAAYSGDEEFAKQFQEGADAHEINGRMAFPDYDQDPSGYRQKAKPITHGTPYGAGPKTLAALLIKARAYTEFEDALAATTRFQQQYQEKYQKVAGWQARVRAGGNSGFVTNDWGRRMVVSKDRSFTQAPALMGQSGTRELIVDGLIRLYLTAPHLITRLKAQVHDALIFSLDKATVEEDVEVISSSMSTVWKPQWGGMEIEFPVAHGPIDATDWYLAGH